MKTWIATLALGLSVSLSAAPVDLGPLNQALDQIAQEILKTSQFKDADGNEVLDSLQVIFPPGENDWEGRKVTATATLNLKTTAWAPGRASSLSLEGRLQPDPADAEKYALEGALLLNTDTVPLVRHAVSEIKKKNDPCSPLPTSSDPAEEKYLREACESFNKMVSVKSTEDFLNLAQKSLEASVAAYDEKLKTLTKAGATEEVKTTTSNRDFASTFLEQLKVRPLKEEATFLWEPKFEDETQLKLSLNFAKNTVALRVHADHTDKKGELKTYLEDFFHMAEVLQRAPSDAERQFLVDTIKDLSGLLVNLAKEFVAKK